MPEIQRFCTFTLAGHCLGVEVERVQEVLRVQEITPVPLAAGFVHGLINLRGQIVTAFDLRERLALPRRPAGHSPVNVVIRHGEESVSLLVDEIGDVVEAGPGTFERPPETLEGPARELIRGAHKLDDRLLLVLDTDRTLDGVADGR